MNLHCVENLKSKAHNFNFFFFFFFNIEVAAGWLATVFGPDWIRGPEFPHLGVTPELPLYTNSEL
jgi:hypothetical protein